MINAPQEDGYVFQATCVLYVERLFVMAYTVAEPS